MAGLDSPFHSFDSLDISAKPHLEHDYLGLSWKAITGRIHTTLCYWSDRTQELGDTFVLLTDFPFTAYKASGTLRNADHVEQFFQ
jgi:hypothetical protein